MISVTGFIELLKAKQLWLADQSIQPGLNVFGRPVTDSRLLKPGDAFICIKGYQSDGHNFIVKARQTGAAIIIQEDEIQDALPAIRVSNSRKAAALMAKLYFDNPTAKFSLIGVTGTNGKTTTSLLIRQALSALGFKTGWIGTLGYQIESDIIPTNNTTPDIMELNGIFADMVNAGCQYVVMEVSSHALTLDRVYGLEFEVALFTNLTREHLDFHRDMQDYFQSKNKLFDYIMENQGTAILNIDDEYGQIIFQRLVEAGYKKTHTVSEIKGDTTILGYNGTVTGCEFDLQETGKPVYKLKSKLVGHFNMLNLSMAIAAICTLKPEITIPLLQHVTAGLLPIRGRLEKVENNRQIGIFVDYAHTPDALTNVLEAINALPHNRIITVFGAGGDRDKGKRQEMLRTVLANSDAAIITDDNPRTEDPIQIIKEIVGNNDLWKPWWIIRNREKAIQSSLRLAREGDIILIAGKGHETYQEIDDVRQHFDDVEIAARYAGMNLDIDEGELILPVDQVLLEIIYSSEFIIKASTDNRYSYVSTDSREIKPGSLFFALKGENFDGLNYVDVVLSDKSNAAVVNNNLTKKLNTIFFQDTQVALGWLARKYLLMFEAGKIALTGSTGKTTTKEFLANIFSECGELLKTQANENNIIGLSKTIFRIKPQDIKAIFELGTNHPGEIACLAEICNPDIAIITNIGPSHLEFFHDEGGVYREKTDLFRRKVKTFIFPGDDERFAEFQQTGKGVGFTNGCSYKISDVKAEDQGIVFNLNEITWQLKQQAPFYITDAAYAIACGLEAGISPDSIQKGLLKPLDQQMRMEIKHSGSRTLIIDCYNANPISMLAALDFWEKLLPGRPHIAILGDMLELGEQAIHYHQSIGSHLSKTNYNTLLTVGDLSKYYAPANMPESSHQNYNYHHFNKISDFIDSPLISTLPSDGVILIKASHGMHLEKLVELFEI